MPKAPQAIIVRVSNSIRCIYTENGHREPLCVKRKVHTKGVSLYTPRASQGTAQNTRSVELSCPTADTRSCESYPSFSCQSDFNLLYSYNVLVIRKKGVRMGSRSCSVRCDNLEWMRAKTEGRLLGLGEPDGVCGKEDRTATGQSTIPLPQREKRAHKLDTHSCRDRKQCKTSSRRYLQRSKEVRRGRECPSR
jgi:hypothetical protein